jgi:hypothetical protein
MELRFGESKETPQGNFPRDVATAIKSGFIATVSPSTNIVSRTGGIRSQFCNSKTVRIGAGGLIRHSLKLNR